MKEIRRRFSLGFEGETIAPTSTPGLDSAGAWQAVIGRDHRQQGQFDYAVVTTGVYCRPGCSSRRPLQENVIFSPGALEAEAAGFRACRRCRASDLPTPLERAVDIPLEIVRES
jgi:AraC family transcriptional regulator, regulatory protein of adaptative response / methylated-DNA-[protein]-cysteine methyltransferase